MKIFVAAGVPRILDIYFPPHILEQLEALGTVRFQQGARLTEGELIEQLGDAEVLISHWGTPCVTEAVLDACPNLALVAHATGSVAGIASEATYSRGVPVLSANPVLARYVAEAILGHMILGLRRTPAYDAQLKAGAPWPPEMDEESLFGLPIGFIGLGIVGRFLLDMLRPFAPEVRVYDPYIPQDALAPWPFARLCDMDQVLDGARVLALQASKTPETFHLVNDKVLASLPDGALVINAGRGAVLDTQALIAELERGRLRAVLDVYEQEPLPTDHPLRRLPNVVLIPHRAGTPARHNMTQAIVDDLKRYATGQPLTLTVSYQQYRLMTQA